MKTLDGGTRVYVEGQAWIEPSYPLSYEERERLRRDVANVLAQLRQVPDERCRRFCWLVEQQDGRIAWRTVLLVDYSEKIAVVTGRSVRVAKDDFTKLQAGIARHFEKYEIDWEPDAQAYWEEQLACEAIPVSEGKS
ncbi:hypothetical protein OV203_44920 [Nannocystis sp. ILAH1]|uniref:hypothetical protein n=1 Tax=Nannocystis sp. ILAH1 TaxID=2996789 RepID=UPI002271EAC6|nr:hypothetical protein [Nannocystis sp. ILAH1]MCY0994352.1 hypothetical protein [Nannocystis sp. ILAH1]